ncbi:hypothetical protein Tco_1127347 [Tanacetum coccineum]
MECEDNQATSGISVNKDYVLWKRMQMLSEKEKVVKAYMWENNKTNLKDGDKISCESEMCLELQNENENEKDLILSCVMSRWLSAPSSYRGLWMTRPQPQALVFLTTQEISQSSLYNTLTKFFNSQAFVLDSIAKIPIIDHSSRLAALESKEDVIVSDVASLRKNLQSLIKVSSIKHTLAQLVKLLSTSSSESATVLKSTSSVIESFGPVTVVREKEPETTFKPILYNIKGTRISILFITL